VNGVTVRPLGQAEFGRDVLVAQSAALDGDPVLVIVERDVPFEQRDVFRRGFDRVDGGAFAEHARRHEIEIADVRPDVEHRQVTRDVVGEGAQFVAEHAYRALFVSAVTQQRPRDP
jgi:hypothetical protein